MTNAHDHVLRWRGFDVARWALAAAVVLGVHAGAAGYILMRETLSTATEPPAAIVIDLSPEMSAPASQDTELPPGPIMEQQPDQPKEPDENPDEVEEEPIAEAPKPPEPEPEAPPAPKPEVAVAEKQPDPPPPEEKKPEVKPDPKPVQKPKPVVERKKPPKKKPMPATTAPERVPRIDRRQAAPVSASSAAPSTAMPAWRSMVSGLLQRNKRYPSGANGASGVAQVSFTISGGGQAGSVRLSRGTGNAALDQEAVELVRRIGSFPPPPEGKSVSLTFPLNFSVR